MGGEEFKKALFCLCLPEREWRTGLCLGALLLRIGPGLLVQSPLAIAGVRFGLRTSDSHELVEQRIQRGWPTDYLKHFVAPRDSRARPLSAEDAQEPERCEVVAQAVGRQAGQRKNR